MNAAEQTGSGPLGAAAAGDGAKVEEIVQEMQALAERTKLPSGTEKLRLKDLRRIRDFIRELRKRMKEGTVDLFDGGGGAVNADPAESYSAYLNRSTIMILL
jgi:hypothetical protein